MKAKPSPTATSLKPEKTNAQHKPASPAIQPAASAKWPEWLSIKEAARILSVSSATIRRLRETFDPCSRQPFLLSCKPTPRTILISAASVREHQQASQQLEFWDARQKVTLRLRPTRRKRKRPARQPGRSSCKSAARKRN